MSDQKISIGKVEYFDYEKNIDDGRYHKVSKGFADFMSFGVESEYADTGSLTYSSAIIKLPCGMLRNIPVENIKVIDHE